MLYLSCGDTRVYLEFETRRIDCAKCGKVKTEKILLSFGWTGRRSNRWSLQDLQRDLALVRGQPIASAVGTTIGAAGSELKHLYSTPQ